MFLCVELRLVKRVTPETIIHTPVKSSLGFSASTESVRYVKNDTPDFCHVSERENVGEDQQYVCIEHPTDV